MKATCCCFAIVISLCLSAGSWGANLRTVAFSGDPAPGTAADVFFRNFSMVGTSQLMSSALAANGKVTFWATLEDLAPGLMSSGRDNGIWTERDGTLELIAREGDHAPGTSSVPFSGSRMFWTGFNSSGRIALNAGLSSGNLSTDTGIWSEGPGTLTLLAREGSQAPGFPSGVNFADLGSCCSFPESHLPALNDLGQTAFEARLTTGVGGVTNSTAEGIWMGGSTVSLVVRAGDQAPGLPTGATFRTFSNPRLNNANQIAFTSSLNTGSGGVTTANDRVIWSGDPSSLSIVVREGDQAPGTPVGALFSPAFDDTFNYDGVFFNNLGQTLFVGGLIVGGGGVTSSNDRGIWSNSSGSLALIAREGSQAPGVPAGAVFSSLSSSNVSAFNDAGQVAIIADLVVGLGGVTSTNDAGIWYQDGGGTLDLLARKGDHPPATHSAAVFGDFSGFGLLSSGEIAFTADIERPLADDENGIWYKTLSGDLRLLVRSGQELEVAPGVFRTVQSVGLGGVGHQQISFKARFTNGTEAIFVATIPEPTSLALATLCCAMALGRRRVF